MTKNEQLRAQSTIHGSINIVLDFREITELLQVIAGSADVEPEYIEQARTKLVDARNAIVKRGRK